MGPNPLRRSDRGKKVVEINDLPNIKSTKEKTANNLKQSSEEKIEKQMGPNPLRRSDRGKKVVEINDLPNIKSKKEKTANNLKQSSEDVIDDEKTEKQDPDGGRKRKRFDAIHYKALFKSQRIRADTDVDKELKIQNSIRVQGAPDKDYKAFLEGRVTNLDQIEHGDCPQTKSLDGKSVESGDVEKKNGADVLPSNGNISSSDNHMPHTSSNRIEHDLENQQELDTCHKNLKFVEFWVPVHLSNVQLEQYCATLLSNAMTLCSSSKSDTLGAFKDMFIAIQKCCNHPYTVDPKIQQSLMKDKDPSMVVDVGVKASGKLQFLDHILPEIQKHQLKVLILFQHSSAVSGSLSIGHILVDFVHRRFGQNSYEYVDGGPNISLKKQAAINMFNKDTTKFIFLLESGACHQSIKLSLVDVIIIYDSKSNPSSDLKSLQKLSIDSQSEQIMIFRLYSLSTLEEKILKLSENNTVLNIWSQKSRSNNVLLTWGASDLFKKLTAFHSQSVLNISSEESFLKDVVEEFLYILSHKCKSNDTTSKSTITRVQNCEIHGKKTLLHVDIITHVPNGDQPYIFWRKLLEGRLPGWKFLSESSPRQRKRPNYFVDSPPKGQSGMYGDGVKTRKEAVNISTIEPAKLKTVIEGETGGVNEGVVRANEESQSSSGNRFWSTAVNNETSLLDFLKPTLSELCNILKFSEDVKNVVETFLGFVLTNYKISKDHTSALQAFMISLCWIGSSLANNKIDRSESFALAKKHFDFSCEEEEAEAVYKKLKQIKEAFLEHTQVRPAIKDYVLALEALKSRVKTSQRITNVDASKDKPVCEGANDIESTGSHISEKETVDATITSERIEVPAQQLDVDIDENFKGGTSSPDASHAVEVPVKKLKILEREFANKLEEHGKMCEGANVIESTGSLTSEKETVDATVSSERIGEVPAQQVDENSKGGTSSPDASHAVEDPVKKLKLLEREYANKLEEQEKMWQIWYDELKVTMLAAMGQVAAEVAPTLPETPIEAQSHDEPVCEGANDAQSHDTPHASDDYDESAEMATLALSEENAEDSIIRPDALHANEDHNDSCGSDSGNPVCAAISQDKTAFNRPVSSPASDHEIQNEPLQLEQLPESGVQDLEESLFDNLTNRVSPQMGNQTYPLEAEVEWLYTEKDNVTKFHQEMKQRLDTECEKEIAEIVAQISLKYEAKHLEEDIAYNSKKMELETNINRVIMTRILADAFKCKCRNLTLGHPG